MAQTNSLPLHKSVLVDEVLQYLDPKPGKTYLDVTFGTGGHTRAILEKEPTCKVIAFDWDERSIELYGEPLKEEFGDRLTLIWGNFALLYKIARKAGIKGVDGILADFGTSQIQITERPGFSIYNDTALDMRMSPSHHKITAGELINKATEEKLRDIFFTFGQERHAKQIAAAIVKQRAIKEITTTAQLADLIERSVYIEKDAKRKTHPATRVFQALRIFVNKELENITAFLAAAVPLLNPAGRLVCISFHSLEDSLVKHFFKDKAALGVLNVLTPQVVTGTEQELAINPSARSACLRAAQKV